MWLFVRLYNYDTSIASSWGQAGQGHLWILEARTSYRTSHSVESKKLILLENISSPLIEKDRDTSILRQWLRQQTSISEINRLRLECMATACERA